MNDHWFECNHPLQRCQRKIAAAAAMAPVERSPRKAAARGDTPTGGWIRSPRAARPFFLCASGPAAVVLVLAWWGVFASAARDSDGPAPWRVAADFERALDQSVHVSWAGVPLREAILTLARSQRVAVLVDRRVDPERRLDLSVEDRPLREVLAVIAEDLQLGVAYVGPVVYLGPARTSARLATVAAVRREEASRLAPRARRTWLAEQSLSWDDLATPRELIQQIAATMGSTTQELRRVPHDLWAGASLPPLPRADQLTLIAAQFELTYQIRDGGRTIAFVDLPERVVLERIYAGGRNPRRLAQRFRKLAPQAEIRIAGPNVVVAAALEDHLRLAEDGKVEPLPKSGPRRGRRQLYRLAVAEEPLRRLLEHLAEELSLDITFDEEAIRRAGLSLEGGVSVDVQDATIDELLEAILKPAGLRLRRDKDRMIVVPASR